MKLNPNHPVTQMADDQWHKFVGILMMKMNRKEIEITLEDVQPFADQPLAVVLDARNNRMVLRLVSLEEGERLAREEGGLPV